MCPGYFLKLFFSDWFWFCYFEDETKTGEKEIAMDTDDEMEDPERWLMEEKEKLLHFVTKIFLLNFPSYMAYKHMYHSSLEVSKSFRVLYQGHILHNVLGFWLETCIINFVLM